jgi:hypothetical protein
MLRNARKVITTLWSRDLLLAAAVAVALAWAATRWRETGRVGRALVIWAGAMTGFLVVQPALWRNHLSHLVVPLTLVTARALGPLSWRHRRDTSAWPRRAAWLAVVVVVALQVRFSAGILAPGGYDNAESRAAVGALATVPGDARIISDEIGLVWRADRRTPDDLADMSIKQFQQERVTPERLAAIAARPEVCGVLVWSRRHLGSVAGLATTLDGLGYRVQQRFAGQDGARALWVKASCPDPSG